jgi:predicted Zn-dependent protease
VKRPQRYMFIIMTVMVAVYLLLTRLPGNAALALLAGIALLAIVTAIWGYDWFIARRHASRRRWPQAIERYERFEKKLRNGLFARLSILLYLGIYSVDGIAVTRNAIGQVMLGAGDLDGAVRRLRAALQQDPLYPVPYVNLAVIAAKRNDEAAARREMTRALQLGFNPNTAQRILRRALAEAQARSQE